MIEKKVIVGFNSYGGGIDGKGIFTFSSFEEVEAFIESAPVSRSWETMTEDEFNSLFEKEGEYVG